MNPYLTQRANRRWWVYPLMAVFFALSALLLWRTCKAGEHGDTRMVVLLTYWLNYEYVLDPRHALEPEHAQQALLRGAHHVLSALAPYLPLEPRRHLMALADAYGEDGARPAP